MKRPPCWSPYPILWELNSIVMQTFSLFLLRNVAVDHVSETQELHLTALPAGERFIRWTARQSTISTVEACSWLFRRYFKIRSFMWRRLV